MSERDVIYTPFMLRIRAALAGESSPDEGGPKLEPSSPHSIAFAVDEWFFLRARAEHVLAEANAMMDPGEERIELRDEFGTGVLAFVLGWNGRWLRLMVAEDAAARTGRVEIDRPGGRVALHPTGLDYLEDLLVDMLETQHGKAGR